MWKIILCALIFLFNSNAYADGFIPDELTPGSYTLEYGGLYKIIVREANRFFEGQWRDQELLRWQEGEIDFLEFTRRQEKISEFLTDWRHGPPWWTRHWWESFPPEKGGAPPNHSILVRKGETYSLLDTAFFTLSNSMDFKWKSLEASIDFSKERTITVGMGNVEPPRLGWKLRFSPILDISSGMLLRNPTKAIRRIGLSIGALHIVRDVQILQADIRVWYNHTDNETLVAGFITLLRW